MIRLIEPEELSIKWALYKPKVDEALKHGAGECTSHSLFVECMNLQSQCWTIEDSEGWIKGVGITRIISHPDKKELQVVALTGKGLLNNINVYQKTIDMFAKGIGCKQVSVYGRKGWTKALPDGYKLAYHVFIKEI